MQLRSRFLILDCRLPIFGSATPFHKRGQSRDHVVTCNGTHVAPLSSSNQKSKIGNRHFFNTIIAVRHRNYGAGHNKDLSS